MNVETKFGLGQEVFLLDTDWQWTKEPNQNYMTSSQKRVYVVKGPLIVKDIYVEIKCDKRVPKCEYTLDGPKTTIIFRKNEDDIFSSKAEAIKAANKANGIQELTDEQAAEIKTKDKNSKTLIPLI